MKRYIFKYTPELTRRGIIYRPTAKVYLQSKKGDWFTFRVYVDSGADISLFTKGDSNILELNLYEGEYRPIVGIGKILIPAYVHEVKMKMGNMILNINSSFADSDEVPRILGRTDIFKHFKITFNESNLETIFETTDNS
ncbi:MAG: hypothetical protein ACP5ER_04505 [Candidatus Bathyarchaeales archaeon]